MEPFLLQVNFIFFDINFEIIFLFVGLARWSFRTKCAFFTNSVDAILREEFVYSGFVSTGNISCEIILSCRE